MKKYIYSIAIAMTFFSVTSCNESQVEPFIQDTLENERKAYAEFNSVDDFETLFEDSETVDSKADEVSRQFRTDDEIAARSSEEADTLYPEVLQKILNDDHIVKIEDWFIKIDAQNEKVYVLDVELEEEYQDLVLVNLNNENIKTFGTDEEVLTLLKESTSSARRNTSQIALKGASQKSKYNNVSISGTSRLQILAKYIRYGIYFELQSKASYQEKASNKWRTKGKIGIIAKGKGNYTPKNKSSKNFDGQTNFNVISTKYRPYRSARRLDQYKLTATALYSNYTVSVKIED